MATPTTNSVPTTAYDPSAYGAISTLLSGIKWGGPIGTGVALTYSFPTSSSSWVSPYSWDLEPTRLVALTSAQQTAVRQALGAWAAVTNTTFVQVTESSTTVGELRFAWSGVLPDDVAAWAYGPWDDPTAGDVWFNASYFDESTSKGSFGYLTVLHEIGHTLGLEHSFGLSDAKDNYFYTVMSYTARAGVEGNYATYYPTTPMYYDILAMHALYGKDTTTNAGNTEYVFSGGMYWQTIYDAGGIDTITYSGTSSCTINLNIGAFSSLSAPIYFGDGSSSRGTVCIGPATYIEYAKGGIGNDTLTGNSLANRLLGGNGNDTLSGGAGNDTLGGGYGKDALFGGTGYDRFDFNGVIEIGKTASTRDRIGDFTIGDRIDLANIDANTSASGDQAFVFVAIAGKAFTGTKGQLRWYQEDLSGTANDKTIVMGDINGDKILDFQIELTGLKALVATDFYL